MNERERPFDLGTIVLQYINDDERFVGVVVDGGSRSFAFAENQLEFSCSGELQSYLVLGLFRDYGIWSIFSNHKCDFLFPTLAVAPIRTATPIDLTEEIQLCQLHQTRGQSRGLQEHINLRRAVFGFSAKQREVLELVALTQHLLRGGTKENRPEWIQLYEGNVEKLFHFLNRALHLDKKKDAA